MEFLTMFLFCGILFACIILNISIVYALLVGLALFLFYGYRKGHAPKELFEMCKSGIIDARNILLTFILIGLLTAVWRAAGTIPTIVSYSISLVRPEIFLPITFLLNAFVSFLTGTALGSAATMGVICAVAGSSLGIPSYYIGGAVLSGVYFGDRCSPVSTSALLVADLTKTDIFQNIRNMFKTAWGPFAISIFLYLVIGLRISYSGSIPDLSSMFAKEFTLSWIAVIPAAAVLIFSLLHVSVRPTLMIGIVTALPIAYFLQGISVSELGRFLLLGYRTGTPELSAMIDGGGVMSMLKVSLIVLISSAYAGIFNSTGLLDGLRNRITTLAAGTTPVLATVLSAVVTCAVTCNQTLSIMLTKQLCDNIPIRKEEMAINLENSAVLIAALIPWSIASGVPLSSINAPTLSVIFAFFLYIVPLWNIVTAAFSVDKKRA